MIGQHWPLHASSTGKILLAEMPHGTRADPAAREAPCRVRSAPRPGTWSPS
ncbi:IclR family transcriptional regulator domain-containing protein [Streptomyces sp. T028]|uniref:IclR family transcriptional regulator domain-containing protein n=1 Tax=Streptomyces sp. T028 TaxID=3394379 RepID=UPI003A83805E